MDPSEYSTFAAYYGKGGEIIFGLTTRNFGTGEWYNPHSLSIDSLDHALSVSERELRFSMGRALLDIVVESIQPLYLDLHHSNAATTSLDGALLQVFCDPRYRKAIFISEPRTITLPRSNTAKLVNLSTRLQGSLKQSYTRMAKSLMHERVTT